ncbi:MAG: NAD-dependent epimerase/dehydratase family protein, partial [Bacilli bacterium]|nr:NAD-dependent epimerase/dehydratase family protein [Bacilli bacterium]
MNESNEIRKVALVIGANGVIGRNLINHLITLPNWEVIGVSRRGGESNDRVRYVATDLLNIN